MSRKYALDFSSVNAAARINFEAELNGEQYAAVTHEGGSALVIAGAGSGKTRTLTYRVAWLLSQGVRASGILLLTFTNKAAREMLERVAELVPGSAQGIWGGTFHSVGNRILRAHAERIGYRKGFSILDREDAEDLIGSVVAREGLASGDVRFPKAGVLADIFSMAANTGESVSKLVAARYRYFLPLSEQLERAHVAYQARKLEDNVMDFDDLLTKVIELFYFAPDVAEVCQFEHVLVDEYQDTNRVQDELASLFSRRSGNLMVVGDDAQSIYSWRGAHFANIIEFTQRHPGAKVFRIETNYRSVPEVLEVANAAIRANIRQFSKNLSAVRKSLPGVKPAIIEQPSSAAQATFVAQRILELEQEGVNLDEMAVLYRAHFHSMEIQMELSRRGVPYVVTSGLRFFEQAHIKDVAAFMRLAVNGGDEVAFRRVARLLPGVGDKVADSLWERGAKLLVSGDFEGLERLKVPSKAAEGWGQLLATMREILPGGKPVGPARMIEMVMEAIYDEIMREKFSNYEVRREDIATLSGFAGQFEDAAEFLSQLALLAGLDAQEAVMDEGQGGKVTLSTIHQAKGLEWRVVFLVWLADGMFPNGRSAETEEGLEEERRLFYVGITRCRDALYLMWPAVSFSSGRGLALQRRSRFLDEIPEELLEVWEVEAEPGAEMPF